MAYGRKDHTGGVRIRVYGTASDQSQPVRETDYIQNLGQPAHRIEPDAEDYRTGDQPGAEIPNLPQQVARKEEHGQREHHGPDQESPERPRGPQQLQFGDDQYVAHKLRHAGPSLPGSSAPD